MISIFIHVFFQVFSIIHGGTNAGTTQIPWNIGKEELEDVMEYDTLSKFHMTFCRAFYICCKLNFVGIVGIKFYICILHVLGLYIRNSNFTRQYHTKHCNSAEHRDGTCASEQHHGMTCKFNKNPFSFQFLVEQNTSIDIN